MLAGDTLDYGHNKADAWTGASLEPVNEAYETPTRPRALQQWLLVCAPRTMGAVCVRVDWAGYEKVKLKLRACLRRPTYFYRPTQQSSYMLAGDDTTPRL